MKDLVLQNNKGQDVTTSLIVAEVFGKEHSKVMRDIENLSCSITFNAANFGVIEYTDSRGRIQKAYEMTKDGFSFLVMGYTGTKAGKFKEDFINAFNKHEALLKDDDYILMRSEQILKNRVAIAEERIKKLESDNKQKSEQIEQDAPKVNFANAIVGCKSSCLIGELAKILTQNGYKVGQNRLFEWLRSHGYLGTKGERYNVPNQQYVEQGLFEIKKGVKTLGDGVMMTTCTTKVTTKGQMYFVNKLVHQKDLFALA